MHFHARGKDIISLGGRKACKHSCTYCLHLTLGKNLLKKFYCRYTAEIKTVLNTHSKSAICGACSGRISFGLQNLQKTHFGMKTGYIFNPALTATARTILIYCKNKNKQKKTSRYTLSSTSL